MVSIRLIIATLIMAISSCSYAQIPYYDGVHSNSNCYLPSQVNKIEEQLASQGRITDSVTKQIQSMPALGKQLFPQPEILMIPFPQKIIDRVVIDRRFSGEFSDRIACVAMFEIDYHKIAYHLFYWDRRASKDARDIGTVIIADNQKKNDFLLCQRIAKAIIERDEKEGIYRQSYEVGIGIPFNFNSINQFNRDRLKGVPPDAAQCQIRATPRQGADREYILYYGWVVEKEEGFPKEKVKYSTWKVIDKQ